MAVAATFGLSLGGCVEETFEEGAHYDWDVNDCESYYGGSAGGYELIDRVGASGRIENHTDKTLRFDMTVTYENDEGERSHQIAVVVAPGDKTIWTADLTYDPDSEDSSDFWLDYYGSLNCNAVVDLVEATDEAPTNSRPLPDDEGPPDRSGTPALGSEPSETAGFPMDTALRRDGCVVDEIGGVHATGSVTNPFDEAVSLRIWADLVDSTGGVLDTANDIVFDLPPGNSYSYEILLESYGADGVSCSITGVEVQ